MSALVGAIATDPDVSGLLVPSDPIISPSFLLQAALQRQSLEGITQAEIDAVRNIPQIQGAIDAMTGTDADGTQVAIANIRLTDTGDDRVKDAERKINELAAGSQGALSVSSLSPAIVEDEYREATETGMAPLIGLALLLIAVLLLVFMRTLSDMLLTLAGLIISLTWIVGAEGWLGPNGIGLIGPPSSLTAMVPVIIISLTVDYAIQAVSHYREQRLEGEPVLTAVRTGTAACNCPADARRRYDYRQPAGDPVLAHRRDWRLRHRRRAWRGYEPDSDADADSGGQDNHRPPARVARHIEASPPDG